MATWHRLGSKELAEKSKGEGKEELVLAGAKAQNHFAFLMARLKPCPYYNPVAVEFFPNV